MGSAFVLHENPSALWVVFLFPICVIAWLWLRIGQLVEKTEDVVNTENSVCDGIQAACERFRLISDYDHRPQQAKLIGDSVESLNRKVLLTELLQLNNLKFT